MGAAAGATSALVGGRGLSVTQLATDAFGNALAAGLISRTTYASEAPATVDQVAAQLDRGAIDGNTAYARLAANTNAGDATYAQLVAEMSRAQGYGGQPLAVLADNSFGATMSDAGNGGYDFERSYIDAGGVMQVEASTTPFGADVTVDSIDPRTGAITWDSGAVSYPVGQAQTVSKSLDGVIGAASSSARGMQVAGSIALGAVDTISGAVQSAGYRYGIVGTAESRAAWAMNVAPAMVESVKNFVADPIPPVQQWWGNLTSGQESAVRSASAGLTGLLIGSIGAKGIGTLRGIGANSTAASPFVTTPTRAAVRELKDFGLDSAQRRSFFEGKQVIFEDPATAFGTATIFKLSPDTLHAGVYDIISDGSGAVLSFANRSRSLGNSLGVKNLELFGADIQNAQLQSLLVRRGFEPGAPVRIDAFGFDKYVETLRKTEVLRK